MDNQKLFDIMVGGLRLQGCKSLALKGGKTCAYRGYQPNTKCAFGFLIPDSIYDEHVEEDMSIATIMSLQQMRELYGNADANSLRLLSNMQGIHDTWDVKDWESRFTVIAQRYDLYYTAP